MRRIIRVSPVSKLVSAAFVVVIAAAFSFGRLIAAIGDLDLSFGIGGVASVPTSTSEYAKTVAVQPDGKIVAVSGAGSRILVARFNPDGSPDSGFGAGGVVTTDLGADEYAIEVLLRPDGRIVVVAETNRFQATRAAVVRYHADGSLDTTFGVGGIAVDTTSHPIWESTRAALQADGGVLVVGYGYFGPADHMDFTILRFTPGGAIDSAFGTGGLVHTNIYGADEAFAITVQPDGRFIVAGFSDAGPSTGPFTQRQFAFARYLPDGTLDASFGTDGRVTVNPALDVAEQSWCYDVIVQPDGRIVGAGVVEYPSSPADGGVVRLLSDGQLDPSFSGDGRAIFDDGANFTGAGSAERGGFGRIAVQSNGRLVVAGGVDAVLGIRPDGTLDPDFHGDGMARIPGPPWDMAVQDDDKVVIASSATTFNQNGVRVIRLLAVNTPPALTPAAISVQRGTSARLTIGTATDTSDPLANLVAAPVAGTVPAGLTFTNVLINATTGAVSALVSPSCTTATGTFDVQFSITDGGNVTTFATVPVTVLANTPPILSIGDRTVIEGNSAPVSAVLVLTATGTVCAPITVNYATADGTAVAPTDYTAASGTATIAVGQSSTSISVSVIGELVAENDETFRVNLDAPVNATIVDGQGVVTIRNDEPSVVQFASATAVDVLETDSPSPAQIVTLKLVRLNGLNSAAYVTFSLSGTAAYRSDYVILGDGFLTFEPGQAEVELRVSIVGDLVVEGTETASITIQDYLDAAIGSPATATITIRDNDGAPPDVAAPIVLGSLTAAPNAAGWHKADVSVQLSASDGTGSGVKSISYSLSGAQVQALTVVPAASVAIPIVTEGMTMVTFFAADVAGNVAASQSLTVRLDKTAPGVVITSPQPRAYLLNEAAAAAYACTDGGSGVASCTGTTAVGARIDTASVGAKTYLATATDVAGNVAAATVAYSVVVPPPPAPTFTIRPLYDTLQEHMRNSAIPIKLQVENAAGTNVSSADLIVEARAVSSGTEIGPAEEEVLDAGQANPLGRFRFISDGAYIFNLKTTNLKAGPYVLVVRVAGDAALYTVPFRVREP